ncbi:putative tyrosine phosphatase [Scheffersomyces amazonensis]|uniref:putative tyrosine phosphatase n=1 Tax=Scheffersomyces amazonensis TaxID=1078765 RepID=UPI00315CC818
MLVPPENFGLVEPGIYRCSKLHSDNFPFVETLKLKSLILVDAEKPPRALAKFVASNKLELFNLGGMTISGHHTGDEDNSGVGGGGDSSGRSHVRESTIDVVSLHPQNKSEQWMLVEKSVIIKSFEILLNKTKSSVLLVDSTSTLVGILRKIQKWNFNSILNEYRIYSGNSTSSNYFAETFLELIQIELVPQEADHVKQHNIRQDRRSSVGGGMISDTELDSAELRRTSRFNSVDEDIQWDDDDVESLDDDDMDDDMLSASPQIPANLLKLVESRQHDNNHINHNNNNNNNTATTSRHNSFGSDLLTIRSGHERRRSSIDSKFVRLGNSKFRAAPYGPGKVFESSSPSNKRFKDREAKDSRASSISDFEPVTRQYNYNYYKNLNKFPVTFENVSVLKLKLPSDSQLPDWFVRGRDFWEDSFNKLN